MGPTTGDDPFDTQRDVAHTVAAELGAVGLADAQEIGRGGFGVVYRCRQTELDRTVAVKVLTADLDDENRARFFREQRAMGRLTGHPNIVNVLQVGATDRGRPYIVMPYHPLDSLDARVRGSGPLGVDEVLRLGVKLAGALETAHRAGIVHRDVKPANVLVTDYGEPELTDFGIAHITGGFETGTGTVTGSPAFTAPEVLSGDPPSAASDIYGLGATLFCALTGHAAFERHSGEQVIAQFLRITTQPVPDLREQGFPEDVCAVVERAMAAAPGERPGSAAALGEALRQIQAERGRVVDEMALHSAAADGSVADRVARAGSDVPMQPRPRPRHAAEGNLPLELTSFVGRRRELTEAKSALSGARLVTLTGIGGVGKTRLALRVAADVRRGFPDGVWWVELGDLTDGSLLVDVVAATLGLRDHSGRPLQDLVVEFLVERRLLLVLDNCEQVVDAVAKLTEALLRNCRELRVLATSRESLGIGGEVVLRVPPLTAPEPDREPTLRRVPQYDAVTLFAERAAAAVPGFALSEKNVGTVVQICHRLDGLPLPIELAAARLQAMSVEQILGRLTDRYGLLTRGERGAPSRQQTLRLSIDWSFDLCTVQEQQLWSRLSVFAGSAELDGVEGVCADNPDTEGLLDTVTSLVEKSILIREESGGVVRFRMLETLRDYGRKKLEEAGEYEGMRRRHRDWYLQLVLHADTEWISSRQAAWIGRLRRELPNLREAMEYCLTEPHSLDGLRLATALFPFWTGRMFSEGRYWFDRILDSSPREPSTPRIRAIYDNSELAEAQGDIVTGTALVAEGRALAEHTHDPTIDAYSACAAGVLALFAGDLTQARAHLDTAAHIPVLQDHPALQIEVLLTLGTVNDLLGDSTRAIDYYQHVLDITGSAGESMYRAYTLWALGVAMYRQGDDTSALRHLGDGLNLASRVDSPLIVATCLEALAWIADRTGDAARSAVLMGAAEAAVEIAGSSTVLFPDLHGIHDTCERRIRRVLGERAFETARSEGASLDLGAAIAYALGESVPQAAVTTPAMPTTKPTKRERQVADLVAEGLTNKEIAARLFIAPRTAQGHVEHLLSKLGFNSRAQIAAWVVDQER